MTVLKKYKQEVVPMPQRQLARLDLWIRVKLKPQDLRAASNLTLFAWLIIAFELKCCAAAYKNWVCAMFIPFQRDGVKFHPCRDFCSLVEQQCPYFLPDTKLQYAGESTFICTDPDIEEDIESMSEPPPYAELPHCYLPCHLGLGRREDLIDEDKRCHRLIPVPSSREIVTVSTTIKTNVNTTSRGVPIVQETLVVLTFTLLLGLMEKSTYCIISHILTRENSYISSLNGLCIHDLYLDEAWFLDLKILRPGMRHGIRRKAIGFKRLLISAQHICNA
uniref:FZ domain-containing protein n=1 Tax=Strigamia maritima TaxID=126957 RepID=T1J4T6_STRMM